MYISVCQQNLDSFSKLCASVGCAEKQCFSTSIFIKFYIFFYFSKKKIDKNCQKIVKKLSKFANFGPFLTTPLFLTIKNNVFTPFKNVLEGQK